jgi:hypothetical protein
MDAKPPEPQALTVPTLFSQAAASYTARGASRLVRVYRLHDAASWEQERSAAMIEVDPRTRSSIWGFVGVLLAAGWAAYGILGGNQVFLAVMVVLSIVLSGAAIYLFRARRPS